MVWVVLGILATIGFVLYRGARRVTMSVNAAKLGQKGTLDNRGWQAIPFHSASTPMRMALTEVYNKAAYQSNFKVMFGRFVDTALLADKNLNKYAVDVVSSEFLRYLSVDDLRPVVGSKVNRETYMIQAAVLFALICTQDKGLNIKKRLMEGKNKQVGNDMYLQQRTDREYFEFMNNHYPNFCQLASILEPRKSVLIEIVAGYLLTE